MQTDSTAGIEEIGGEVQTAAPRSPGQMLRASRKQRGLSKKEVADTLHITAHYVNALEHDQYDKLPGEIFAKGYMKRYAEIMELDQSEVLAAYAEVRASDTESESAAQAARSRSRNNRNKLWVAGSLLVFAGLFTGLWFWNQQGQSEIAGNSASSTVSGNSVNTAAAPNLENENISAPLADFVSDTDSASVAEAAVENAAELAESVSEDVAQTIAVPEQQQASISQAELQLPTSLDAAPDAQTNDSFLPDEAISAETQALQTESPALETAAPEVAQSQPELTDMLAQRTEETPDNVISVEGPGSDTLRISFSGASWVEVNDGEENQIYRDLRVAGDVLEITGSAPFSILLGDAPLARLTFNGNEIDVSDNIRIDNSARLTVGL